MKLRLIPFLCAISFCLVMTPYAALALSDSDLTNLPLESLLELQVTSVSKKTQPVTNAAAAIFVITQENIRRSGVTSIAEALRMAPGVQVARIDSNKWAVTSRGFNGRFANKLLVLMDGRSLYTPFFIGVYWEVQDTALEDIDRIEVIRGPGAALWGSNAVNGVINIITKTAENTQGVLLSSGGGSYEKAFVTARYGATIGDTNSLRMYAKHVQRDSFPRASGQDNADDWQTTQGGFRLDSQPSRQDRLTLQGDYYSGSLDETYLLYRLPTTADPAYSNTVHAATTVQGGNLLTRWQRTLSDSDTLAVQLYFDHTERSMLVAPQTFNTIDLDFQHHFSLGNRQDVVWGGGYRYNRYTVTNTATLAFDNQNVVNNLISLFLHDEIQLIPNQLALILGARLEHNDVSGFITQPNGRLLWTVSPQTSVWGAVSRAVRASTKGEQDIHYFYRTIPPATPGYNPDPNLPLRLEIDGNHSFKPEAVLAYEIGGRSELRTGLSLDLALYYNTYKHLRVITPGAGFQESGPPLANVQPYYLSNDLHGHSFGAELALEWALLDWWRLQASYSYQRLTMYLDGTSIDTINKGNAEGDTPQHQFSLRSGTDLGRQTTLDLWLRGTDRLASIDGVSIPGYLTLDARLAWRPVRNLELALVGQNLLTSRHPEFIPEYINTLPAEVARSVYGKLTWKF